MEGVPVLAVEDDASAPKLLRIFLHRLVVTDRNLPGIDGHEPIHRLRADPVTAAIPIVVVSAAWPPPGREGAEVAGADAFLARLIEPAALAATVERLLARDARGG